MKFEHPKLFESVTRGGDCALCGEEIARGDVAWVWNGDLYCGSHKRTDVEEAAKCRPSALRAESEPITGQSLERTLIDGLNEVSEAIREQTRAIQVISAALLTIKEQGAK